VTWRADPNRHGRVSTSSADVCDPDAFNALTSWAICLWRLMRREDRSALRIPAATAISIIIWGDTKIS
jgi:hypothetical protein